MDERNFYDEREVTKNITLMCPGCKQVGSYPLRWKQRTKKSAVPRGAGEEDKKNFAAARSYMVRVDDLVACRKCRKRIEITGQSVVLSDRPALGGSDGPPPAGGPQGDVDPDTFFNR